MFRRLDQSCIKEPKAMRASRILQRVSLIVLLLASLSPVHPAFGQDIEAITASFFQFMKDGQFDEASRLFHYPPGLTDQKLSQRRKTVATSLQLLQKEFGKVIHRQVTQPPGQVLSVTVTGGSIDYWEQHPQYSTSLLEVEFDKEGEGFLLVSFCDITGELQIRSVKYGLLLSRPGAKARIIEVMRNIVRNLPQRQQSEPES